MGLSAQLASTSCSQGHPTWTIVVAAVVSCVGTALLCCLAWLLWIYRDLLGCLGKSPAAGQKGREAEDQNRAKSLQPGDPPAASLSVHLDI